MNLVAVPVLQDAIIKQHINGHSLRRAQMSHVELYIVRLPGTYYVKDHGPLNIFLQHPNFLKSSLDQPKVHQCSQSAFPDVSDLTPGRHHADWYVKQL
jgi:hypothetical protein